MIGNFIKRFGLFEMWRIAMMHEAGINDVLDLVEQMLPIASQIENDDRFLMQTKLPPGGNLHGLVERTKPAGQNNERIALSIHHFLALVHRVHDMQFGDTGVTDFNTLQKAEDNPCDMAARLDHDISDPAHKAHLTTTIYKTKLP